MTVISKPDTYSIPGQPEVDFVADEVTTHIPERRVTVPMSELEMLTRAATDAAESMHHVPDFGEPTDPKREEHMNIGGGVVSAVELVRTAPQEVAFTSPAALIGVGQALKAFREDR